MTGGHGMDGDVEVRVILRADGSFFVKAPKGLQSMRIVTDRRRIPAALGHRVRELAEEVLAIREAGSAPPVGPDPAGLAEWVRRLRTPLRKL
jgi:hypothetical protein